MSFEDKYFLPVCVCVNIPAFYYNISAICQEPVLFPHPSKKRKKKEKERVGKRGEFRYLS